jgi:hypothetical protein
MVSMLCFISCQNLSSLPKEYGTWSFSGYVIDGYTQRPLLNVSIRYLDTAGTIQEEVTDSSGKFFISGLPFGDRSFQFVCTRTDTLYTQKIIVVSSYKESSNIEGVIGDVSRVISLFPLAGSVSGEIYIWLSGSGNTIPARNVNVEISYYNDTNFINSTPIVFAAAADSVGRFGLTNLPIAPGALLTISSYRVNGLTYKSDPIDVPQISKTRNVSLGRVYLTTNDSTQASIGQVRSNVLSTDGFGLTGVAIDISPWYIFPTRPVTSTIAVAISGGGSPNAAVRVSGDTVFIDPVRNFSFDSLVTISITGTDTAGNSIGFVFDGVKRFRTERGIFPVASNTWTTPSVPLRTFKLNDTIWVKFSELLDTDINKIDWAASTANKVIYGSGSNANASVWVKADTLFVRPDQRLAVNYGETMGFKVNVMSAGGKRGDTLDVIAEIIPDIYYIKWTNAKDAQGNMREDFGPLDSVVIVSNVPVAEIRGVSGVSKETVPYGLTVSNIYLRGNDTIVFKPSLYLLPDSTYGVDFDVLFQDSALRYDVLGVTWKIARRIQILSVDNTQSGMFRPFHVIGDSLTVTFSKAVDTGINAAVPFRVTMTDVKNNPVRTIVRWNPACTIATIINLDTLPSADFNASPAYTLNAVTTRAVESVTFDLITRDGEQAMDFRPVNEDIEIHTERGLCVVNTNVLQGHDSRTEVDSGETPVNDFPVAGAVWITFNRALDTTAMNAGGLSNYIGIRDTGAVASAIAFSADARTISVTPSANLKTTTNYYVWLKNIPGVGIAGAAAINKNAGICRGLASNNALLKKAFQAK